MTTVAPYPPVDGTQPCAGEDPELFFAGSGSDGNAARRRSQSQQRWFQLAPEQRYAVQVCGDCPFIRPCLAYALTHHVYGVWGGTTETQRDELRREHGIQAIRVGLAQAAVDTVDPDLLGGGVVARYIRSTTY